MHYRYPVSQSREQPFFSCANLCISGIVFPLLDGAFTHTCGPNSTKGGGLGTKLINQPQGGHVTPRDRSESFLRLFLEGERGTRFLWGACVSLLLLAAIFAPGGEILTEMKIWKESWSHCLFEPLDPITLRLFQLHKLITYLLSPNPASTS